MEVISPEIIKGNNKIILKSEIKTNKGLIKKEWIIDTSLDVIKLKYYLNWQSAGLGKLSIVPTTLNPRFLIIVHFTLKLVMERNIQKNII